MESIKTLEQLWEHTNKLNRQYFPNSDLFPIHGGGQTKNPKFMFVFINPTIRNISSLPDWCGKRRPFTGTKHLWRIFTKANHFDEPLLKEIEDSPTNWSEEFANRVYDHLKERSFYFTNIIKWTGYNADLPNTEKIKLFLPLLEKEIELVNPKYIVTFGLIPFKGITGQNLKLQDAYDHFIITNKLLMFDNIIPCYFPVGRGNPKRAIEILRHLHTL